jgi:predicted Zn-dependent peptidase
VDATSDHDVRRTELPNGLRVLTERMPEAASVSLGVWIESGSRHDGAASAGLSHFVEHLLFKGTERRSAIEISQEIEGVGGMLNAETEREHTCYYAKVLADDTNLAVDLLSDMVLCSRFDPVEIERERNVVLEEVAAIDDAPDDLVHDLFHTAYWPEHPLGQPICGTSESVEGLSRASCLDLLARRYRPNRVIVTAAGRLDHDALHAEIARCFGDLLGAAELETEAPVARGAGVTVHERALEQVQIFFGTTGVRAGDEERTVAAVLNAALGDGSSSRLFQEIRERQGHAYAIDSFLASYRDTGYLGVTAGTRPQRVADVVASMLAELRRVRCEGFPADELARTKGRLKGSLHLALETTEQRMEHLAIEEMYLGRARPVRELAARIDAVTNDQVVALAERLFVPDASVLVLLGTPRGASVDADLLSRLA